MAAAAPILGHDGRGTRPCKANDAALVKPKETALDHFGVIQAILAAALQWLGLWSSFLHHLPVESHLTAGSRG